LRCKNPPFGVKSLLRGETGESGNWGIGESWNRGIVESWNRKTKKVYLIFFAVSLGILRQNPQKNGSFLPIGAGPRGKQDDAVAGNKAGRRGLLLCKTPDCKRRPFLIHHKPSSCLSLWGIIRRFSVCRRIHGIDC